jgi:hypothetical protein
LKRNGVLQGIFKKEKSSLEEDFGKIAPRVEEEKPRSRQIVSLESGLFPWDHETIYLKSQNKNGN